MACLPWHAQPIPDLTKHATPSDALPALTNQNGPCGSGRLLVLPIDACVATPNRDQRLLNSSRLSTPATSNLIKSRPV